MGGPAVVSIRRQVLDVDLHGTEADGLALQRCLPRVCAEVLSPAIEAALGPMDPGDGHVSLDRIAIDVTLSSLERLETELVDAVRRALREHLREHPRRRVVAAPDNAAAAADADAQPGDVRHRTAAETVDAALCTFLRTGRLPWSFRLPPGRTLEQVALAAWGGERGHHGPPRASRERLRTALALPEARDRLVLQFGTGFTMAVLRSLSPDVAALVARIERAVGDAPAHGAFTRQLRVVAVEAAVARCLPRPSTLVQAAWSALTPVGRASRALAAALESAWPGSTDAITEQIVVPAAEPAPVRQVARDGGRATPEIGDSGGLLVDCAGIVLLHPFLPQFFAGLGLTAGDDLREPGRALCLLHHLATGERTAPEHRTTLAKALCGLPLDRPVEADVGLTDAETAEADALLQAVIRHWEALRNSSPDALRAEFLQRPGVLSDSPDGDWLLRVENRTADILLDQLPWGCSPVWLPWMGRMMMVEWR